jgi:hypothetical protein
MLTQQMASPAPSTRLGTISGVLLNYNGQPASGYTVYVVGTSPTSTAQSRTQTDEKGAFTVEGLKLGGYVLDPYQEGANSRYMGGASMFYDPTPVRVNLSESELYKQLTLHLGSPNRIFSGTVTSSYDGSPVIATLQIEYPGDLDRFIRFGCTREGTFKVLIPPKTKLMLKVTAPGYMELSQVLEPVAEDVDPQLSLKLKPGTIGFEE